MKLCSVFLVFLTVGHFARGEDTVEPEAAIQGAESQHEELWESGPQVKRNAQYSVKQNTAHGYKTNNHPSSGQNKKYGNAASVANKYSPEKVAGQRKGPTHSYEGSTSDSTRYGSSKHHGKTHQQNSAHYGSIEKGVGRRNGHKNTHSYEGTSDSTRYGSSKHHGKTHQQNSAQYGSKLNKHSYATNLGQYGQNSRPKHHKSSYEIHGQKQNKHRYPVKKPTYSANYRNGHTGAIYNNGESYEKKTYQNDYKYSTNYKPKRPALYGKPSSEKYYKVQSKYESKPKMYSSRKYVAAKKYNNIGNYGMGLGPVYNYTAKSSYPKAEQYGKAYVTDYIDNKSYSESYETNGSNEYIYNDIGSYKTPDYVIPTYKPEVYGYSGTYTTNSGGSRGYKTGDYYIMDTPYTTCTCKVKAYKQEYKNVVYPN